MGVSCQMRPRIGVEHLFLSTFAAACEPQPLFAQSVHTDSAFAQARVLCSVFALIGALGYIGLRSMLGHSTETSMSAYNDVVKLAPKQANLTITLP